MNSKKWNYPRLLAGIILILSLLCSGCLPKLERPEHPADSNTTGSYEHYTEEAIKTQKLFDQFTDDLFKEEVASSTIDLHYSLSDPAAFGITEIPITFGDYTLEKMKEDTVKLQKLKEQLETMNPQMLLEDQLLTYRILMSYLDTELSSAGLELYAQPLTSTIGIQAQLPVLLAEYPFYTRADADTYLALLSQIDTYYGQLLEFEKQKSAAGLFMSDASVDNVLKSCEAYLLQPDHSFMAETFDSRIDALTDLTNEEKASYKSQNLTVLSEHFVPAYQLLIDGLTALKGTGASEGGLSHYPEGKRFYEYLVNSNTGTSYGSVPELKAAIEDRMNKDLTAMSKIMKEHPEVLDQLESYRFCETEPEAILENLKFQLPKDFPELPACNYTVKQVPTALQSSLSPAFYLTPPIDRFTDNVIYINGGSQSGSLYTTLAHEGYPGHLYQTVYFINRNTCNLRHLLSFGSYSEGWATYVEHYSYTLDNGLDPNLGQLLSHNSSVTLALYAMLDISINYDGWSKDQVHDYLSHYYNVDGTDVVDSIYYALIENPTNYLEYYVGCLEIQNMRDIAEEAQGKSFNLKDFHKFILDIGPAPFSVIQPYFRTWLVSPRLQK